MPRCERGQSRTASAVAAREPHHGVVIILHPPPIAWRIAARRFHWPLFFWGATGGPRKRETKRITRPSFVPLPNRWQGRQITTYAQRAESRPIRKKHERKKKRNLFQSAREKRLAFRSACGAAPRYLTFFFFLKQLSPKLLVESALGSACVSLC